MAPPRIVDVAIGLSIFGWALAGLFSQRGDRPLAVLASIACLHLTVAVLFLVRRPAIDQGDWRSGLIAIPAVLVGGWVFYLAPPAWRPLPQILFVIGSTLAIISLAILGRCFAILPALRGVVIQGPYTIVRHPAYLGELLMVIACLIAAPPHWGRIVMLMCVIVLFIARILAEERLLSNEPIYRRYCAAVSWRLIPWLW